MSESCKYKSCNNLPNGMNGYYHECTEDVLNSLLKRLSEEPLAEERQEFGMLLMKHIDSFTISERKRYDELKEILSNS